MIVVFARCVMADRVFQSSDFLRPSDEEPIRSVIDQTNDAVVIAWCVKPQQRLHPHIHPNGQDTWIIQAGEGQYLMDQAGTTRPIKVGDVVVARAGQVHGVLSTGPEPLVFVSIVSPANAGFEPI